MNFVHEGNWSIVFFSLCPPTPVYVSVCPYLLLVSGSYWLAKMSLIVFLPFLVEQFDLSDLPY